MYQYAAVKLKSKLVKKLSLIQILSNLSLIWDKFDFALFYNYKNVLISILLI